MPDINKLIEQLTAIQDQLEALSESVAEAIDEVSGGSASRTSRVGTRESILRYLKKVGRPVADRDIVAAVAPELAEAGMSNAAFQVWKSIRTQITDRRVKIRFFAAVKQEGDSLVEVPFIQRDEEDAAMKEFPGNLIAVRSWLHRGFEGQAPSR